MKVKMSEVNSKEVNCRRCSKRVPLGKFCIECGEKMDVEPTDDEPRPPVQVSDATSSESGKKLSAPAQSQNNTSTATNTSSYADAVKNPQQNAAQQNQQSQASVTSTEPRTVVNVHTDPSKNVRGGHCDTNGNSMREVRIMCDQVLA